MQPRSGQHGTDQQGSYGEEQRGQAARARRARQGERAAHSLLAAISVHSVASANAMPANLAAGRHRRERSSPVGNIKNKKPSMATAITHPQSDSQANTRPAGKDPGAATSACSAYEFEKPLRPSASPATRNRQPIRFSGRLDARDKPSHRHGHVHDLPGDAGDGPVGQAGRHQLPVHVGQRQPAAHQRDRSCPGAPGHPPGRPGSHPDSPQPVKAIGMTAGCISHESHGTPASFRERYGSARDTQPATGHRTEPPCLGARSGSASGNSTRPMGLTSYSRRAG